MQIYSIILADEFEEYDIVFCNASYNFKNLKILHSFKYVNEQEGLITFFLLFQLVNQNKFSNDNLISAYNYFTIIIVCLNCYNTALKIIIEYALQFYNIIRQN